MCGKLGKPMHEWMYQMLINPVVNLLDPMEPKDKLIIVASEACIFVCDNVKSWSSSLVCVDFL
jgi:hypothetical protein